MKKIKIVFEIETLEDFHLGSGLGVIGLYDSGVEKDKNGNPKINSETFKGLLKESCREIDKYFVNVENRSSCFDNIFNDFYNMNSIDILNINVIKKPEGELYNIYNFTEIGENNVAKDKSLRNIEFAARGVIFEAELQFTLKDSKTEKEYKEYEEYLKLGLKNIRYIGGYRRRGFGEVKILIKENTPKNENKSKLEEETEILSINNILKNSSMNDSELLIVLENLDDVTISERGQIGNGIKTLDYIPGTTILGMLRNILFLENIDKDYLDDGKISVENFYPLPQNIDIKESIKDFNIIPVPLSIRRIKKSDLFLNSEDKNNEVPFWIRKIDGSNKMINIITNCSLGILTRENNEGFSDKSFDGGYFYYSKQNITDGIYYKPEKIIKMRNRIEEETQKCGDDSLFSQEQIEKGTKFLGKIKFDSQENLNKFLSDYNEWLKGENYFHIGKGGKAVKVVNTTLNNKKNENIKLVNSTNSEKFTITFLSDSIVFSNELKPLKTLDNKFLSELLEIDKSEIKIKNYNSSYREILSYSGTAGMRRFTDTAIKAGSCYLIEYSGKNKEQIERKLEQIELNGIGIRKHEGFGKVAINLEIHTHNWDKKKQTENILINDVNENMKIKENEELYNIIKKLGINTDELSNSFRGSITAKLNLENGINIVKENIEIGKKRNSQKKKYEELEKILKQIEKEQIDEKKVKKVLRIILEF